MTRYPQAVMVSCELPWDEKENLIEEVFRKEIRLALAHFHHVYIFGTCGEGYAVDTGRFRQVVQIFHEETRGRDVHPMVSVIGLSTANVVERVGIAHDIGFRTFQIALPCWGALGDAELLTYFQDVCGAFGDSQFLHYNLVRSKRVLGGMDYRRLIDAVGNLVATKSGGGGLPQAEGLMRHAPELQHFFGETEFAHGCLYGECSLLSSFGPLAPDMALEYFEAGRTRQIEKLFRLQQAFHDLANATFAGLPDEDHIDGCYDKMLVRMGGLEELPLRLLSPYHCFSEELYQECKSGVREKFPHLLPSES